MGISNFLNRLQRSESGNVIAICAGLMPLLMGSAALAIDATQLALWKRQLQRTADSSAIAGAYAFTQTNDQGQIEQSVENDIDENPHPPIIATIITAGPANGFNDTVTVALTSQKTLPFANIFTNTPTTIQADATAAIVAEGNYCLVSLYDGPATGITISGNARVTLGCGMIANSRSDNAVSAGGNSQVTATPVGAVGGLNGSTNYVGDTTLLPYTSPLADPLAYLPDPVKPTTFTDGNCTGKAVGGQTLKAGSCYASWEVGNHETLFIEPGVHYVYGGDIDVHGKIQTIAANGLPEGATIILTGLNGQAGTITANAQAEISVQPQNSGTFNNISFYRDRRAGPAEVQLNGGSDSVFTGAYYFPTADIRFNGNATINAGCLQMIGQQVRINGTFDLTNNCAGGNPNGDITRRIVRLVE